MKATKPASIRLNGRKVDYRLVRSKSARNLRVRVGLNGVEVLQPSTRNGEDVQSFLTSNAKWVVSQIERVERMRSVRRSSKHRQNQILFRGEITPVRVDVILGRQGNNKAEMDRKGLVIKTGPNPVTPPAKTLENWLRKQAKKKILEELGLVVRRVNRPYGKIFVMGQQTKWGNCSSLGNLSFNWRLIMAPDYVLRYMVTHEAVHLAVPDHSKKFWLTVQSLCPEMEKARQWLCANGAKLFVDLDGVLSCG